ncbi:uncharacterized protein LOC123555511 [Mercenaria mercenaria]|uniref:uncharacterized protein LOC123555511 n=1 Tax=Mercenaria mercenaria TaxID=6596 RepID=UPI00234EAD24|nr:uncharacterized protein LOC123555511 [Mercenaria mercenaria]
MQVTPNIFVTFAILFIGWCFAQAGWQISQKHGKQIQTKSRYSFDELSQRGVPLSTCPDCYTINSKPRLHVRYRGSYQPNPDIVIIESIHDMIIVIASLVIATSWVTIFSLFLHSRINQNVNQGFNAMVMPQIDPHQTFIDGRRQG